jgi:hypothetical protein
MIIRKNDSFTNDNGELVVITGKHFNDYAVSIYQYNDDTEEYDIFDRDTFYTTSEVRKIAKAKEITWSEEE